YFSKLLKPQLEVDSGDYVTIEALTHHASAGIISRELNPAARFYTARVKSGGVHRGGSSTHVRFASKAHVNSRHRCVSRRANNGL
ncbi:MAG: hypothetical protein WAN75_35355, partial [Xanthobacteraceae bacterium]